MDLRCPNSMCAHAQKTVTPSFAASKKMYLQRCIRSKGANRNTGKQRECVNDVVHYLRYSHISQPRDVTTIYRDDMVCEPQGTKTGRDQHRANRDPKAPIGNRDMRQKAAIKHSRLQSRQGDRWRQRTLKQQPEPYNIRYSGEPTARATLSGTKLEPTGIVQSHQRPTGHIINASQTPQPWASRKAG